MRYAWLFPHKQSNILLDGGNNNNNRNNMFDVTGSSRRKTHRQRSVFVAKPTTTKPTTTKPTTNTTTVLLHQCTDRAMTRLILRDNIQVWSPWWRCLQRRSHRLQRHQWQAWINAVRQQCHCLVSVEIYTEFWNRLTFHQQTQLLHTLSYLPALQHIRFYGRKASSTSSSVVVDHNNSEDDSDDDKSLVGRVRLANLASFIQNAKNLQTIFMDHNVLVGYMDYNEDVHHFVTALSHHPSLTHFAWYASIVPIQLSLPSTWGDDIDETATTTIPGTVTNRATRTTMLSSITQTQLPIYDAIVDALCTCRQLQTVSLPLSMMCGALDIRPVTVTQLVSLPTLTYLYLRTDHWDAIADGLLLRQQQQLQQLQDIDSHGTTTTPILQHLHLRKQNVVPSDTVALGRAWMAGVVAQELSLTADAGWNDETVQPLTDAWCETARHHKSNPMHDDPHHHVSLRSFPRPSPEASTDAELFHDKICIALLQNHNLTVNLDDDHCSSACRDGTERVKIQSTLNQVGRGRLLHSNGNNDIDTTEWITALEQLWLIEEQRDDDDYLLPLNCTFEMLRMNPAILCSFGLYSATSRIRSYDQ